MANKKKTEEWEYVKKKCRLNDKTISMAKELGINPRTILKNMPNEAEKWKAPVDQWIEDMYEKEKTKAAKKAKNRERELKEASKKGNENL